MKIKFRKKYFLLFVLILVVLYLFWGPLFPWSPIKPGFEKIELSKATVYITEYEGVGIENRVEKIFQDEELFHDLRFNETFKIIILGKESNMKRFLPWLKGTGYSVKLGIVNVIYIGPNARNTPNGMDIFLRHELSHLLIHQNTPASEDNFEMQRQGWLTEGVATYFGGPHYWNKDEFVMLWKEYGREFNSLYEENPLKMGNNTFRLKYTYYRFFIEYLINTYGLSEFQDYLKKYMNNPKDYKNIFSVVYGQGMDEILIKFSEYMEP